MSKLIEEWRPVVGYEGLYEVSDWGRVKSVDRIEIFFNNKCNKNTIRKRKGRIINIDYNCKGGYGRIYLNKDGNEIKKRIHRVVAETFIPNPDNKPCVGHWDCNVTNNKVENLYWCTVVENNNNPITKQRQSEAKKRKIS